MEPRKLTPFLTVAPQISVADVAVIASSGFHTIINNRPDNEGEGQPESAEIEAAAKAAGLDYHHLPCISGGIKPEDIEGMTKLLDEVKGPVLAFCRTGTRSTMLWGLSEARHLDPDTIIATAAGAGYDLAGMRGQLESINASASGKKKTLIDNGPVHDVVIVGGGAGGIATASSLLKRRPGLDIVICEPAEHHYYQPGWTLVGGGVFNRAQTQRSMASVMPDKVKWKRVAVEGFEPQLNRIVLEDGERLRYRTLIVSPGIKLNWDAVEGLSDTLGRNGVTSNYKFDMAPYTWELVQGLRGGKAVFTQPPMPIKCAGAPQKALYLSCDAWRRNGRLNDIDVQFFNAGGVLFGVEHYVPELMKYINRYNAQLNFHHNLVKIDGDAKKAWFKKAEPGKDAETVEVDFDMIHVCPPQCAPDFVSKSDLANDSGWVDVSPETLQSPKFGNVFGLGDACSAPNAKTAAAVRKQAPVVAENILAILDGHDPMSLYDGYGSCPLTVERGKIVLAEFGYGGKLLPTLPTWLLNGGKATRSAWFMKEKMLPPIYFDMMLKGREWLAEPQRLAHKPVSREAADACVSEPRK